MMLCVISSKFCSHASGLCTVLAAILHENKATAETVSGVTSGDGIVKGHSVFSEAGFVPQGMKIS